MRKYGEAARVLREALKESPNNLTLLNMLAPICLKTGHALEAISLYTKSLSLNADDAVTHTGLVNALITAHRLNQAVSQMGYIKRSFPRNEHIYAAEVRLRLHQNQTRKAYVTATNGLKAYPTHPVLLEMRASAGIKLDLLRSAHDDLQTGLAIYPNDPYLNCTWADLLRASGRMDKAIDHLESYLGKSGNGGSVTTTAKLGHFYLDCGDNHGFARLMDQASERVRRLPIFGSMAAKGFWLTGQDARAADIAARILDINVTEMAAIVYLASTPAKAQNLRLLAKICGVYTQDERVILDIRARRAREDRSTLRDIDQHLMIFNGPRGREAAEIAAWLPPSRADRNATAAVMTATP